MKSNKIRFVSALLILFVSVLAFGCSEDDIVWTTTTTKTTGTNNSNTTYSSQGTMATPVYFASILSTGEVTGGGDSYYTTFVNASTTATIDLYGMINDADLYLYSDSSFSTQTCSSTNSGTTNDSCTYTCGSSGTCSLYILVHDYSTYGTYFYLANG